MGIDESAETSENTKTKPPFFGGSYETYKVAVEAYGESFYVYDIDFLRRHGARMRSILPADLEIIYSIKANPNVHLIREISAFTQGVEVSSEGELAQALAAGVPCERILLIGPAKSRFELDFAVRHQFRAIVVESAEELDDIEKLALHHQAVANVMVRINPDFQSQGARLTMTGASTQFGMEAALAVDLVRRIDVSTALRWSGLHVYIGTRILDAKAVVDNFKNIMRLAAELKERSGVDVPLIDFGGGLGVPYFDGENDLDLERLGAELKSILDAHQESNPGTRYLLESGRYIVAQCGRYVTTVRQVKQSKNAQWILTAGGINQFSAHNFMGGLLRRNFPIQVLPTSSGRSSSCSEANICGPLCTPSDILANKITLPQVMRGDLIAIDNAGAYGYSVSPFGFLSHASPSELLWSEGVFSLARVSRGVTDLLGSQQAKLPNHLMKEFGALGGDAKGFGHSPSVSAEVTLS